MWKVLSTTTVLAALFAGTFGAVAEAKPHGGPRIISINRIAQVRIVSPILIKKPIFVKAPILITKPYGYRTLVLVGGGGFSPCTYAYRKWQATGFHYWKARYYSCTGIY